MLKKVLPNTLSKEELLELLESAEDVENEVIEHNTDVVPFLSHYNITPGDQAVSKKLLYKLYKRFYSKEPIEELKFNHILGQFLGQYYNYSGGFYKINHDNFTISIQMFENQHKKSKDKTKSVNFRKHFDAFLVNSKVSTGNVWMEGYLILEIYKDYCIQCGHSRAKLGRDNFHKFMKLYFKSKRVTSSRGVWYKVSEETSLLLTEEQKNDIKARRSPKNGKQETSSH